MSLLRSANAFEESSLLFFLMKLLGLLPLSCCKTKILNYANTILFLTLYYLTFALLIEYAFHEFDTLNEMTTAGFPRKVRYFLNPILFLIAIFSSVHQSSKIEKAYHEINEIDRYLQYFNVFIDHKCCMKQDIVFIFGIIMTTLLFNLMDYYSLMDYSKDYMHMIMCILDRIPDFINTIMICCISILLDKIRLRFEQVNEIIERIIEEKQLSRLRSSTIEVLSVSNNNIFRAELSRLLNQKLCKVSALANEVCRFPLMFLLILYFVCICIHTNTVYSKIFQPTETVEILMSISWVMFDIGKFAYILCMQHIAASKYVPWIVP